MKRFIKIISQIVIMQLNVLVSADVRIYNKSHHPVYFALGNPRKHPSTADLKPVYARHDYIVTSFPTTYTQLLLSRSPKPTRGSRLNAFTFNREFNPVIWVDIERDGATISPSKDAPADNIAQKDIVHGYITVGYCPPEEQVVKLFKSIANQDFKGVQDYVKHMYHLEVSLPDQKYEYPLNHYYNEAFTPLLAAFDQKQYRIARYLIHNGANAHARTLSGKSGLDVAAHANVNMIKLLHREQVSLHDKKLIHAIVKAGDLKALKYVEKHAVQLASISDLLHHAASQEMAEYLIQLGFKVNKQDENGRTPLYYAIEREHRELIQALMDKGAQPTIKDNESMSPADLARSLYKKRLLQSEREKAAIHRYALSLMSTSIYRFW